MTYLPFVDARDFSFDPTGNNLSNSEMAAALSQAENGTFVMPSNWNISVDESFEINAPTKIIGSRSKITYVGAPTAQALTQRIHANDGTDPNLSVGFIVNSHYVRFEDVLLEKFFDGTETYPDFGSALDALVFVKSKAKFSMARCLLTGYNDEAGLYVDVTQNNGGCDGMRLENCTFQGLWGVKIAGPIPEGAVEGDTNVAIPGDVRGGGGMSDFVAQQCTFLGTNYHESRRRDDTVGGGLYIDGRIPNTYGKLNGFTFIKTRGTTAEPFVALLDNVSNVTFISDHAERSIGFTKTDGTTPADTADVKVKVTENAANIRFIASTHHNVTDDYDDDAIVLQQSCILGTSSTSPYKPDVNKSLCSSGTFTPKLGGTTTDYSGSYTIQNGFYDIINGIAFGEVELAFSSNTGLAGNARIEDLPFSCRTGRKAVITVSTSLVDTGADATTIVGLVTAGTNIIQLFNQRDGQTTTNVTAAAFPAGGGVIRLSFQIPV